MTRCTCGDDPFCTPECARAISMKRQERTLAVSIIVVVLIVFYLFSP